MTTVGITARERRARAHAPRRLWALIASTTMAGGIHLAVGYHHGLATAHGGFLLAVGLAQSVVAVALARRSDPPRLAAAVALNTVVAAIWFVVHIPATISGGGVASVGLTATSLEVLAVLLALAVVRSPARIQAPMRLTGIVGLSGLLALMFAAAATDTGHTHRHDDVGNAAEPATGAPIFGDLFSDHLHDAPTDDHAEPHGHLNAPG